MHPRGTASAAPLWTPDQGDGTFRNPVLGADYSDPDAIRVGDDFFLIASSFNCTPGLPILHSHDLVNWTIVGHALENLPHPRYEQVQHGCGVWAPAIRFHAGRFWIFFPTPDEGVYVITSERPTGSWSKPHRLLPGAGLIDPCPLWDEDGKAYLVHAYARSRAGICDRLRVRPMAPDASRVLGEGEIVFHSPAKHPTLEGPKFLKKDGWYYILAPAGGVATGWQVALRSKNIYGPYEDKIVLEQGGTAINGPHQGALVDTPDGGWWFLHFQDAGVCGRIVHLQPVLWREGWPMIGRDQDGNGVGEPVSQCAKPILNGRALLAAPQSTDEFESEKLGLQWQWYANHRPGWHSLAERKGWLRLHSQFVPEADLSKTANLLLQKFPARAFTAETFMEFAPTQAGEEAGLAVTGGTHAAIAIRQSAVGNQIVFRMNGSETLLCSGVSTEARFYIRVTETGWCEFQYSNREGGTRLVAPGFQATAGVWIGAKLGIYSLTRSEGPAGHADFDWFRFAAFQL